MTGVRWRRRSIGLIALFVVAAVVMAVLGMHPSLVVLAGIVLVLGATAFLIGDLHVEGVRHDWTGSYVRSPRRLGADYRVNYLRRRVEESCDRGAHSDTVAPVLRKVVAERLRESRGIDLDTEPRRARQVLGDRAVDYLRGEAPKGRTDPAMLEDLIGRIEEL